MVEFKLGTYIKKRREELGLSQEELCDGFCAVSTLSRIENHQQNPSRSLTKNLLERLGLPQDKFTAFWGQKDVSVGALMREIPNDMVRHHRASREEQPQIAEVIWNKLSALEEIADLNDRSVQQFLLAYRTRLGALEGRYSVDTKLSMQMEAIRLTSPKFDQGDIERGHYSMNETRLINQIANTYSEMGQRKRAISIFRQLLNYVEKNHQELVDYASLFGMIAYNYALALGLEGCYWDAIDIAEQGRKNSIYYGVYQFLPGFLAIQAECYYYLEEEELSKKLYIRAYYIYDAFGDVDNREIMRQEMRTHLGIEMSE